MYCSMQARDDGWGGAVTLDSRVPAKEVNPYACCNAVIHLSRLRILSFDGSVLILLILD